MNILLIAEAKDIARQQKVDRKVAEETAKERHLKEIYDEVVRILEECIKNKKIYDGCIKIRTHNIYRNSHKDSVDYEGYYDWDTVNIYVWGYEGVQVAEMICNKDGIHCEYRNPGNDDDYFYFNFND